MFLFYVKKILADQKEETQKLMTLFISKVLCSFEVRKNGLTGKAGLWMHGLVAWTLDAWTLKLSTRLGSPVAFSLTPDFLDASRLRLLKPKNILDVTKNL